MVNNLNNKAALKFFQTYIKELVEIGGFNLPCSISSRLGSKLGGIYKERGISNLQDGIIKSLKILNCSPTIVEKDSSTLEVKLEFPEDFCPIGGKNDPDKAKLIQKSICKPYTLGFVKEYRFHEMYDLEVKKCALEEEENICHYILTKE